MDKSTPLVTFFIPCYNYGRFLGDCLQSIYDQTKKIEFEVIVIDDASADNTPEIIKNFSHHSNFKSFRNSENKGHVYTINKGLSLASGTYVARIDADDFFCLDFLEKTLPLFIKDPSLGAIFGNVYLTNEKKDSKSPSLSLPKRGSFLMEHPLAPLLKENFIPAPTLIAKREAWQHALPIPDGFKHSDWYLSLRISEKYSLYYLDEFLAFYRVHPNNHHSKIIFNKGEEETRMVILDRYLLQEPWASQLAIHRRDIYSTHFLNLAQLYYSFFQFNEARRCYRGVLKNSPAKIFQLSNLKYFTLSHLPKRLVSFLKKLSHFFKR